MCQKSKIISSVKNGELSMCTGCHNYSLMFNNVIFQFDKNQLLKFREYVSNINIDYWLQYGSCTTQRRKIPIQTFHENLVLVFDLFEINELKKLLGIYKLDKNDILSPEDIDYTLVLN
ncbi:DUF6686 family protein [Polaribacter irgensii]|jgi:hypothetical protein|nr:DUF6686 family protein [Polaribacter irgensii]